jgi:hypothetical protein
MMMMTVMMMMMMTALDTLHNNSNHRVNHLNKVLDANNSNHHLLNNSDHRVNHLNNDNLMVQRKRRMTMEVKRRRRRSL